MKEKIPKEIQKIIDNKINYAEESRKKMEKVMEETDKIYEDIINILKSMRP